MTDQVSVTSVTPAPAVSAPAPTQASNPPPPATTANAAPPKEATDPVALDVVRSEGGLFVYTLTDSATGRVLQVIPGEAEKRTAGSYASGGWVSLTA